MTKKINVREASAQVEDVIDGLVRSARESLPHRDKLTASIGSNPLPGLQTLSRDELTSLYALLAYTAYEQQVLQETVQAIVEAHFGVRHVTAIRAADFERAVSYIADLRVDQRIN